jgi:hypothetical protein
MNGKSVAIIVLLLSAVVLATMVVNGGHTQAQAGRFADYAMLPVQVASDRDALLIIDTTTERMVLFDYDLTARTLTVADKADLRQLFGTPGRP